ncbi:internal virion protein C [Pseudomonas phage 10P302A]|uniref:Internal virion protein C n=1 Tax=Pseudomonas phage 10P302A TaxID=3038233 RepID=A0AAF0GLM0_9CAUD|nr:internal virion protein C [Pseudomonas phage 10P302A]
MAGNEIAKALAQSEMGGKERLHGSTATVGFQASQQRADVGNNGFADAMANFVKSGTNAYGQYAADKQKNAQAESDKIIRSMSLQQRREAIERGDLHLQDDPDVMNILRHDTGRTAAFEVESEIQNKLANGEFDEQSREELEEYRRTRLEMVAQSYAKEAGIDANDPDYQRGFNSDIVRRNAGLFDLHDQRRSKRYIAQTVLNTRGDTGGLLDDPDFMRGTDSGAQMAAYFNGKAATGGIPTDQALIDAVNLTVNDAIKKDHGPNFLSSFRDQEITVMGVKQKVGDVIGQEKYDNLMAKASEAAYQRNRPRFEKFQLGIAEAVRQADPARGWDMIQTLDTQNQWVQEGDQMTPQKQALINAKIELMDRVKQDTQRSLKATEEATQADNRLLRIDQAYEGRMKGDLAGTAKKDMPVDADTGEFKESDWATYASRKLAQIDAMDIPVEQKDLERGKLLQYDHQDGPFRRGFQTLIDDATNEWTGAVTMGELGDTPKIDQLTRVYAQQPQLIAALYPDKAGFIEKMNQMKHAGINPAVLIESERKNKDLPKEERINRDVQWEALKRDSEFKNLSAIPTGMDIMARSLYDSFVSTTGDASSASKMLSQWLDKNTISFKAADGVQEDGYQGMINKKDLMADPNDANSWEQGKQIVDETITGIKAASPYWADSPVSVEASRKGDIQITSLTGERVTITRQQLSLIYQARKRAAAEQEMADKVGTAQRNQGLYKDFVRGGRGPL